MNTLLPVLASNPPQMSLCTICPAPGACCNSFRLRLDHSFNPETWMEEAQAFLDDEKLPFTPLRVIEEVTYEDGTVGVIPIFGCTHVTAEGRCSIYETRPETCRIFVPGSDHLCVFHPLHQRYMEVSREMGDEILKTWEPKESVHAE